MRVTIYFKKGILFVLLVATGYSLVAQSNSKSYVITRLFVKSGLIDGYCRPADSPLVIQAAIQLKKVKNKPVKVKDIADLQVKFQLISKNGRIGRPQFSSVIWKKAFKKAEPMAIFPTAIIKTDDTAVIAELFYKNQLIGTKTTSFQTCKNDSTAPPKPCDVLIATIGAPEVMSPTPEVEQFIYDQEYRLQFTISAGDTSSTCNLMAIVDAYSDGITVNKKLDAADNRFAIRANPDATTTFDRLYKFKLPKASGLKELMFKVTLIYFYTDNNLQIISGAYSKIYKLSEHVNFLKLY